MLRVLLVALFLVGSEGKSGKSTHCIGNRAHVSEYDVKGDTLQDVTDAVVTVTRTPENDRICHMKDDADKIICIGANADKTCQHAAETKPVNDWFECKNCFAGATTDLFYRLNISGGSLQDVAIGLQKTQVNGAVEMFAHKTKTFDSLKKTIALPTGRQIFSLLFHAGPLPVSITASMPNSELDLSFQPTLSAEATLGVDIDLDLGDYFVQWTKAGGFSTTTGKFTPKATPVFEADAQLTASVGVALHTGLSIEIEKVLDYNLHVVPSVPTKVTTDLAEKQACMDADMSIDLDHDGDVKFTLLGHHFELHHFPDTKIFHYDHHINKCLTIPVQGGDITV